MFYTIIEKIAEAITRGAIKAVWAELRKPRTATDEEVTDEDHILEDRLRNRLRLHLAGVQADGDSDPERNDSAPVEQEGSGPRMAQEEGRDEAGSRA